MDVAPNDNVQLFKYNWIKSDHPSNSKRDGVCMYYKETLKVTSARKR